MTEPDDLPRIHEGFELPAMDVAASATDIFRFSAVTWNAHRIHLDPRWAEEEGLPGAVVQAHLHGAWFARLARSIAGPDARLTALAWKNKAPVVASESVTLGGSVIRVERLETGDRVQLELVERGSDEVVRADGTATVFLPKEPS